MHVNCEWWSIFLLTGWSHYSGVMMGAMAFQITSLTIVYATVYSGADQRKHQNSASLAFVRGIHRWPVNSPHKGPVMRSRSRRDGQHNPKPSNVTLGSFYLHCLTLISAWISNHMSSNLGWNCLSIPTHHDDVDTYPHWDKCHTPCADMRICNFKRSALSSRSIIRQIL